MKDLSDLKEFVTENEIIKSYDWEFFKTDSLKVAGGKDEFDECTEYIASNSNEYEFIVSKQLYDETCEDSAYVGLNYGLNSRYTINVRDQYQIMLIEKTGLNFTEDEKNKRGLKLTGYDNKYELLVYDSVGKKTIKYKVTKVKEVNGYHPIL